MEFLKEAFTSSKAKSFYWQTANGFVVLLIGIVSGINPNTIDAKLVLLIAGILAVLNGVTKFINKTYLTK